MTDILVGTGLIALGLGGILIELKVQALERRIKKLEVERIRDRIPLVPRR